MVKMNITKSLKFLRMADLRIFQMDPGSQRLVCVCVEDKIKAGVH